MSRESDFFFLPHFHGVMRVKRKREEEKKTEQFMNRRAETNEINFSLSLKLKLKQKMVT